MKVSFYLLKNLKAFGIIGFSAGYLISNLYCLEKLKYFSICLYCLLKFTLFLVRKTDSRNFASQKSVCVKFVLIYVSFFDKRVELDKLMLINKILEFECM